MTGYHTRRILYIMDGKKFRRIRKRLGLSQKALAERMGTTENSVARWERGEIPIRELVARFLRLIEKTETPTKKRR